MRSIILKSLKQSFTLEDRKFYCFLLFLFQASFIILFSYFFVRFYINIIELLGSMIESVSKIDFDNVVSISQSAELFSGYDEIIKYFAIALAVLYLTYALINSIIWHISNYCVSGENNFWKYNLHFLILSFIFIFPAYFLFRIIHGSLINFDFLSPTKIVVAAIILITWYFMMISFALINKYKIKQLKKHLKQTFIIGYRKALILIPTYLIIISAILLSFYLIYLAQDSIYLSALLLSVFLFLWVLVWSRLYFLITMRNIQK